MAKSAKLVLTTFISRVIVDDNTTDEQIAALVKSKIQEKLNNDEVLENIEVILPDEECPYGTFEHDESSSHKKNTYSEHELNFLQNGFHHVGCGLFRKYYDGSACVDLQEIGIRDMKHPQFVNGDVFTFITDRTDYRDSVKHLIVDDLCPRDGFTSDNYRLVLHFAEHGHKGYISKHYAVHEYYNLDSYGGIKEDLICPVCEAEETTIDSDAPEAIRNCNQCGSKYTTSGEITFNPKEL